MRVLMIHNEYLYPGGEEAVFAAEASLLRRGGHQVAELLVRNSEVTELSKPELLARTVFSLPSYRRVLSMLTEQDFDLVHVHNFFPLVSPAAYYACRRKGIPVVQTLHNYRLICPAATLFRDGRPCESCVERTFAWPGVVHRCYRDSRRATGAVAAMLSTHKVIGTWRREVSAYIALTNFAKGRLAAGGLDPERIFVKPNFVHPDPGPGPPVRGGYAIFVGRMSPEKGLSRLLKAWREMGDRRLKIVGDGPCLENVIRDVDRMDLNDTVEVVGRLPNESVREQIRNAAALVFPSQWYEGFPLVIAEAFAAGTPVVGSRLGSTAEIVQCGVTGLLFDPVDPQDLAEKMRWCFANPEALAVMSQNCRAEFEAKYSAERNLQMLESIYARLLTSRVYE